MNSQVPGIYLFVGGPIDGERRYVEEPLENLMIEVVSGYPRDIRNSHKDIYADIRTVSYRLEELREGDYTYFVYVGGKPAAGLLIRALINGYRA